MAASLVVPAVLFVTSALAEKRSVIQLASLGDASQSKAHAAEHHIWETFQALPKNEFGRLDLGNAATALQRYFAREQNLRVKTDSEVVQEALKQANPVGRGITSKYLTEAISVVERAISKEPHERLQRAFETANVSCVDPAGCTINELSAVLTAYLKAYVIPGGDLSRPEDLADELRQSFEVRKGHSRRNPFQPQMYSFQDALAMVEHFGRQLEGQSRDLCELRSSDSSCLASGQHHSVCCASPCESIMAELEAQLQAPVVAPDRLLRVVSKLSFLSDDDAGYVGHLPRKLQKQLENIGERHGGDMPLHGEDVAEWLHSVFPMQCPLPKKSVQDQTQAGTDAVVQPAREWSISMKDLTRIGVLGLIAFAMLRAAMAQWQTANGALKCTSKEMEKKPQYSAGTTFV